MDPAASSGRPAAPSLLELARGVLRDLPALVGDRVELFALEMQRAGYALLQAVAMAVVATILGVTAWLALWSILVGLLVSAGWHWAAANGLAVVLNIGAAAWAVWRARRALQHLSLPATRRHLMLGGAAPHERVAGADPLHDEPTRERDHAEHPAAAT